MNNKHLQQLADEVGKINFKRAQRREKIDFSKYNLSNEEQYALERNYDELRDIEGALTLDGPLGRFILTGVKGGNTEYRDSLYTIKEALIIVQKGQRIRTFGVRYSLPGEETIIIQFDIETRTKLIECKNINWPPIESNNKFAEFEQTNKLILLFCKQHKIAQYLGKEFEVSSATEIPQGWKKFFNKHAIKFVERYLT